MPILPRGYTAKDVASLRRFDGVKVTSELLSATTPEALLQFGKVLDKVSVQASGSLVCNVLISVNGIDFVSAAAAAVDSSAIISYSTHAVTSIKVVRVSGEGKLHLVGY